MQMKNKIGIAVVTGDKQDFFEQCIKSIPSVDYTAVVQFGKPYSCAISSHIDHITCKEMQCVAINKNRALRAMIQNGCEHLFLIEDDIVVNSKQVCEQYIRAAAESGIWHLNYCSEEPINTMEYDKGSMLDFFKIPTSSFSYYHKNIIKHVGYFDERFRSGLSGHEHTYRVAKLKLCPPYGVFASSSSKGAITELDHDKEKSTLDYMSPDTIKKIQDDTYLFLTKHNETLQDVTPPTQEQLEQSLKFLQTNYSKEEV